MTLSCNRFDQKLQLISAELKQVMCPFFACSLQECCVEYRCIPPKVNPDFPTPRTNFVFDILDQSLSIVWINVFGLTYCSTFLLGQRMCILLYKYCYNLLHFWRSIIFVYHKFSIRWRVSLEMFQDYWQRSVLGLGYCMMHNIIIVLDVFTLLCRQQTTPLWIPLEVECDGSKVTFAIRSSGNYLQSWLYASNILVCFSTYLWYPEMQDQLQCMVLNTSSFSWKSCNDLHKAFKPNLWQVSTKLVG